ncbi:MAG: hypothetical protein H6621_05900 [Halobacteriovoraceae bacterium]|nr:hypothetical protein [Halobacteriovoraceae bacterium]
MRLFSIVVFLLVSSLSALANNKPFDERIMTLQGRKSSIYTDRGIFYYKSSLTGAQIKSVRSFFSPKKGFERIVIDFTTPLISSIYGYISTNKKKLYLDILDTKVSHISKSISGKYLSSLNVYELDASNVNLEFNFKNTYSFDIFYLESPGRIVIDVKR